MALAASILLHLLGTAGLRWPPRGAVHRSVPVADGAIEVTVVEPVVEPVLRQGETAARLEDQPPTLAPAPQRDRRRGPPRRAPGDAESTPPHDDLAADDARPADVPRARDVPEIANHPPAPKAVDLSFQGLGADAKFRAVPSAREDPLLYPAPPSSRRRRPMDELMARSVREADAVQNVQRGRAHPLLFDYLRGARVRLEPEATRLAEALPLGPSLSVQGWARGYLGRVAEIGRKGSSQESLDSNISNSDDPTQGGRRPDLFPAYNEATRQAILGGEQRAAEICLGVAPDRPVVVALHRSSGHAALDQLAIDAFRRATLARPVAADVRPGLACYQVRISAFRVPPLPTFSFGIKNGRPEVVYPLKRLTKVTVDLVSVDHGDSDKPGSLLLRAR